MLVNLKEKSNGKMIVEFEAENAQEVVIMAMATQPEPENQNPLRASLGCHSLRPSGYGPNPQRPVLYISVGDFKLATADPLT